MTTTDPDTDYYATCDAVIEDEDEKGRLGRCCAPAVGFSDIDEGYLAISYPWPACRKHTTMGYHPEGD